MKRTPIDVPSFHDILLAKMATQNPPADSSTDSVKDRFFCDFPSGISHFNGAPAQASPKKTDLRHTPYGSLRPTSPRKKAEVSPSRKRERYFSVADLSTVARLNLDSLGVEPDLKNEITVSQVKKAFKKLARKHHPDLNPAESGERFCQIQEASQIILTELEALAKHTPPKAA